MVESNIIEIEVTSSVAEQYKALVEEYGEADVQTALLQSIIPTIRESYNGMESDQ